MPLQKTFDEIISLPWNLKEECERLQRLDDDFIVQLTRELDVHLREINKISDSTIKEEGLTFCRSFICRLIQNLTKNLPVKEEIIKLLDFVKLENKGVVKEKVLKFNEVFKLEYSEQAIVQEVNDLFA